jgi:hypothetical protein
MIPIKIVYEEGRGIKNRQQGDKLDPSTLCMHMEISNEATL